MTVSWLEASEIVSGIIVRDKLPGTYVDPAILMPPYDELITEYGEIKDKSDLGNLITNVGLYPVQSALDRIHSLNGTTKIADWIKICETAKHNHEAGYLLEKFADKLQRGDNVDWSRITEIASNAQEGVGNGFVPLSDVEAMEVPFKETGFKGLDVHFGGLPEVGQVLVGGSPGSGKTSWMLALASSWVRRHPDEVVLIYTLEMLKEELKMRLQEVFKLTEEEQSRILVDDATDISPNEVISKAATIENRGLICVDYVDLLIEGETTESVMSNIYRTFMKGSKNLYTPIVNMCQFNRGYNGGIPRPYHFRYTGMAEALAWGLLCLYNPNTNWFPDTADDEILPRTFGKGYIVGWKFRGGFRVHTDDNPGAIQVSFLGEKGWNPFTKGEWFPVKEHKKVR